MGRPKPLLAWHGATLLEYQIHALFDGGATQVVVVLGHEAGALAPCVERTSAGFVVNHEYALGKTTSIKAGLGALDSQADSILLLAVDQPRTPEIVSQVIRTHLDSNALITAPRFQGHSGHPLIFSAVLKDELEQISEDRQGIREVFQSHRDEVVEMHTDDPMVRLDLNTPDDYERAKQRYGA